MHELKLTKNQNLVLNILEKEKQPLSAYNILDALREEGFRAPLQVYRALDKLVEFGLVHRIETLNAFVACNHSHCGSQEMFAFTICDTCGGVEELSDKGVANELRRIAEVQGFTSSKSTIELRGNCGSCK
ncbi:MAG: Fur family transcriptional regulator [Nitratireductor sp.]